MKIHKNIKILVKIGDILLIENVTKIGEKSFTKKGENFRESTKTVLNLKGITKIGDNFVENQYGYFHKKCIVNFPLY